MSLTKRFRGKALALSAITTLSACGGGMDMPDLRGGAFNVDAGLSTGAFNDQATGATGVSGNAVNAAVLSALQSPAQIQGDVREHPVLEMQRVDYHGTAPVGSIMIDVENLKLYFVDRAGSALQYPVALGRVGAEMPDVDYYVDRTALWPAWHPTASMRESNPNLPARMEGGPGNPLGAAALYLSDENGYTLFRIHGNNDPDSIGTNASAGCVRMYNDEVTDLERRVNALIDAGVYIDVELMQPYEIQVSYQSGSSGPVATAANPYRFGG